MSATSRACRRGCHEDTTRKLLSWNLALTEQVILPMRLRRVSAARMSVAEAVMTSRCRSSSSSSSVLSYLIHQLNGTCQRQRRVKYCLDSSKSTCCRGVRCEQTWLSGPRSRRPSLHLHVTSDVTRKDEAPQQVEAGMIRTMRIPDPPRVKDMDWSSRVDGTRRNSEIG